MIAFFAAAIMSLSLNNALDIALERNIPYHIALLEAKRTQGALIAANAQSFPSLSIGDTRQTTSAYAIPRFSFPLPNTNGSFTNQTLALGNPTSNTIAGAAQITIYQGGAIRATVGQASATYAAALGQTLAARANCLAEVTRAYWNFTSAIANAVVASEAATLAHENEEIARQRFRAGTASHADLLEQQLTEANAHSRLIDARMTVALDNAALVHVLHLAPGTSIVPRDRLTAPDARFSLVQLQDKALRQRAELQSAQSAFDAARFAVKVARSTSLPTVIVGATEESTHPAPLGAGQPALTTTLEATWRLFDGGLTRGHMQAAEAQVDEAGLQLDGLRADIALQVEQAFDTYQAAIEHIATAQAAKRFAAEHLRTERLRFANGVGTALELSDATVSEAQAENDEITAEANAHVALNEILRSVGEL